MSDSFLPPVLVELGGSDDGFIKTLTRATTALERFAEAARASAAAVDGAFASLGASFESLAPAIASVNAAKKEMQGFARASRSVAAATDKAAAATEGAMSSIAASAERMGEAVSTAAAAAETGIATIGGEAKATAAGLKVTGDEAVVAGTKMKTSAAEAEAMGGKFLGLGPVFDRVKKWGVLGLAGIGIASVDLASHFQTEMTRLSTAAGAPIAQVKAMREQVLATADSVGVSGTKMAEALYHPVSAGLDLKTSLEAVKYAAEEAKISGANLEDTTYSLSSVMKAFNEPASQAKQTMASLNAIVGQGDMRFQDFNQSVKNWAPTAAQMGISINSMGAGLAYLTDRGNSAEVAATRMTMGISMMTTPAKQAAKLLEGMGVASGDVKASTAAMTEVMQKAGVTQNRLATDLKKPDGLYVALTDLKTSLEKAGVSGTEADSVLSKIFGGGRSDKAIMSLMQNLDGLKTKFGDIEKAANTKNFDAAWARTQQTFSVQMDKLKAAAANAGISLGMVLLPAVTKIAGAFAAAIGAIAPFVSQHKQLIGLIASVAGGILLAATAIKTVTVVTKAWAAAQVALDAAMTDNPIGLIIMAIAGLVAGLIYAWTHFQTFRDVVTTVFDAVKIAALAVWHALETAFRAIVAAAMAVWHGMQAAWNGVVAGVEWVWRHIQSAWNMISTVTSVVWSQIAGFFRKWWPLLLVIFLPFVALIIAIWNHFHKQILGTAMSIWNAVSSFFVGIWHGIEKLALTLFEQVYNNVVKPMQAAWHFIQAVWNAVKPYLLSTWHWIAGQANSAWQMVKRNIIQPIQEAWNWLVGKFNAITDYIGNKMHEAVNSVRNIASGFYNIGVYIVQGIINGVENMAGSLYGTLKNLASSALDAAKSFLGINSPSKLFADHVGMAIPEGIAKGVTDHAHLAHAAVRSLASGMVIAGTMSGPRVAAGVGGAAMAGVGAGGGGDVVVNNHLHVNVEGHVLTERKLRDLLEREMLRLGMRNPQTYASYSR